MEEEIQKAFENLEIKLNRLEAYRKLSTPTLIEMFKEIPLNMFVLDLYSGEILLITKAFCNLLLYKEEEVVGKFFQDFVTEDTHKVTVNLWNKMARDLQLSKLDYKNKYIKKDKSTICLHWKRDNIHLGKRYCLAIAEEIKCN